MNGSLRVNGPPSGGNGPLRMGAKELKEGSYDDYLARLIKLIPAEVIAFYLVGYGFIPANLPNAQLAWALISLIAVVVVRASATKGSDGKPQWPAVAIASVSFAIWVYSLGHVFGAFGLYVPFVGSLLVLTWTFFLPYIYKGD